MRKKTVTLIGGEHHLKKITIDAPLMCIRLPKRLKFDFNNMNKARNINQVLEEYVRPGREFTAFTDVHDIFFLRGIDQMLWCKHKILDYLK